MTAGPAADDAVMNPDSGALWSNPQTIIEQQEAARHLLMNPLTVAGADPELFRLIRRHESDLDRWFTQMLGYRLHVDTDTARLFKTTHAPADRPLRTAGQSSRALRRREYTILSLVLAVSSSGPSVISLRDLVAEVRSAAAEAEIELDGDSAERRSLVTVLRWMMAHGLAAEVHDHIDAYTSDEDADAILSMRPDRIALIALPVLGTSETVDELLDHVGRSASLRQRLRSRLVEDPVVYRTDCSVEEWAELRRRLGEESSRLHDRLGLTMEARAEGVAAIDPSGRLSDKRFPTGGTLGHASLLLIDSLCASNPDDPDRWIPLQRVQEALGALAEENTRRWTRDLVDSPERLTALVVDHLSSLMLVERAVVDGLDCIRLMPAAARYTLEEDERVVPHPTLW